MKKIGLLLGTCAFVFALTGCGSKSSKLVCTMTQEQSGVGEMTATTTTHFGSDGNATKVDMEMVFKTDSKEKASTIYESMKSSYDNVKKDGKSIIIKESVEPTEDDEKVTRKEAKETFEEEGYTCK